MKKITTLLTLGLLSFVSSVAFAQADQEAPVADPCTQLDICLSGCDELDDACTGACFEEADPEVAAAYVAVEECFLASGCSEDDFECIEAACAEVFEDQADACFGGGNNSTGNNGGTPTGPCADLFICSEGCEDEDLACAQACVDQMSDPAGQSAAQGLLDCVEAQSAECDPEDDDCLFSACADQAEAFAQVCEVDVEEDVEGPGNNSSNDGEGNNGGVFPGGNNSGSDGSSDNNSSNDDNGAGGDDESDADSEEAEASCATAGMGGKVGHGGLGLMALGLVALGLRRRRA